MLAPEQQDALRALVAAYQTTASDTPLAVALDPHHVAPLVLQQTLTLLRGLLRTHATGRHLVHRPQVQQALTRIRALLAHHAKHLKT